MANLKKIQVPKSLEELFNMKEKDTRLFDFYWRNFEQNAKKENVISAIRQDVTSLINMFEESFFKVRWIGIEDYTMSNARRALWLAKNKMEWRANSRTPIVKTFVDRLMKWFVKANFSITASALDDSWKDEVDHAQNAIEWAYGTSWARDALMTAAQTAMLNGNGYVKAQFRTAKEKINSIMNPESRKYISISESYANMSWISEFELFYDPILSMENQRFVVYRGIKPIKDILKAIQSMDKSISPEHLWYILANPRPFSNRDFNKVRLVKYFGLNAFKHNGKYDFDNIYNIAINNDKSEYIEIWTRDTMTICINGWLVADTVNPYKGREYWHPYYVCNFSETPGMKVSEGAGSILGDIQKAYDALFNLLLDHASMTASPMLWVQAGKVIHNKKEVDGTLKWKWWDVLEMEDKGNMDFIVPPALDQGIISTLQNMLEMANFSISPTSYSDYNSQSRSAQDSMMRFEWLSDWVALLVESISKMLNKIAQNWLLDIKEKMPDLFEVPIVNSKWAVNARKKIKKSSLEGKFLFQRESDSLADANELIARSQINEYLNNILRVGVQSDGSSMVDINALLKHINKLYKWPKDIVLDKSKYYSQIKEDQIKKTEIGIDVQAAGIQQQQKIQEELQQQQAPQEEQMPQEQQMPQEWGHGYRLPEEEPQEQQNGPSDTQAFLDMLSKNL